MDGRLVGWARSVKARGVRLPPLWLFTDATRLPNPAHAILRLPRGLSGVVLRDLPASTSLPLRLLCRRRGFPFAVAGQVLASGLHARQGRRRPGARPDFITASAHTPEEWRRGCRTGAVLIFLSPAFPTGSHPGAAVLGAAGWRRLAASDRRRAAALGGIDGALIRQLPRWCKAIGAIGALGVR